MERSSIPAAEEYTLQQCARGRVPRFQRLLVSRQVVLARIC